MKPRPPIVAGNWKLHLAPAEAREFFRELLPRIDRDRPGTVVVFPTALALAAARDSLPTDAHVHLGVQNVHWEASGAFTGEISASLAAAAGAEIVLVGHSERRQHFAETDEQTARKVHSVLEAGLVAMLCVGETLEERESGDATAVVGRQLARVLGEVRPADLDRFLIAYEPVWAIGTGRTATPADASEMHAFVRSRLLDLFGPPGREVPILYGGSVKPENAGELLSAPDVDGVLVGGASLDPASFAAIWAARP